MHIFMFYNMFVTNNSYLCSVNKRDTKMYNLLSETRKAKKKMNMKKNEKEIFMLQYRIQRYQAMGNGTMCQILTGKLKKLLAEQA